jgi:hypothetical protein
MQITKIVSGGQTGAERGGLNAAIRCGLPYGGWVPKGRRSEDGRVPAAYTDVRETESAAYMARTEANVVDSDATLVLTCGLPVSGNMRICAFAQKHARPCLVVNLADDRKTATDRIVDWLTSLPLQKGSLNVDGARESKVPGMQSVAQSVLTDVIARVNGKPL